MPTIASTDRAWLDRRGPFLSVADSLGTGQGMLTPAALARQKTDAALWRGRAEAVAAFRARSSRWPKAVAPDRDESLLGRWLHRARSAAKGTRGASPLSADRLRYLDSVAPGWRVPDRRPSPSPRTIDALAQMRAERVGELAAFRAEHGRWPRRRSADPVERSLANWWSDQRRRRVASTAATELDAAIPGWDKTQDQTWRENADSVGVFRRENGRWPTRRSVDRGEAAVAGWLSTTRRQAAGKENPHLFTAERRAYLDKVAPDWRGANPGVDWRATADEVARFVAEHNRLPKYEGWTQGREPFLRRWVRAQRERARDGILDPRRRAFLDDHLPYLLAADPGRAADDARFPQLVDAVAEFRARTGRWPQAGPGAPADERHLASWLRTVRSGARSTSAGRHLTAKAVRLLDEKVPGWTEGALR